MRGITRRNFLKFAGVGSLGFLARPLFPFVSRSRGGPRASDVIQCYDDNATIGGSVNQSVAQIMMDESIKTLTGCTDVGEAWKSIFDGIDETKIIGIKVNVINNVVPTRPELVDCIIEGLAQMQFGSNFFPRNNIVIWDRSDWELQQAGFTIYDGSNPDTARCFGTDHAGVGYDYGTAMVVNGATRYPSAILSILCDYLINFGVLKNHGSAQVTLSLKNHYGSINSVGSSLHSGYCSPGIPSLNQQIRDVITPNDIQKLFVIDSLWASVVSGPGGNPDWNPKKLLMSLDTVAVDYRGWEVINEERTGSGYGTIQWPIYHIQTAEQPPYSLGTTDINLIEINNPSTGVEEGEKVIPQNGVVKVSPNPFSQRTTIAFSLPYASDVHIDLTESSGRIAAQLYSGKLSRGYHKIEYSPHTLVPAGSYFVRLNYGRKSRVQRVTIIR